MSEPTQPDAGAPAPEPIAPAPEPSSTPPPASDAPITAREAADLIAAKPAATESSADDAAPPQEPRGETDAPQEPPQEPLKPPRSWSKQEKEAFAALRPEHQEAFLAREKAREADIQLGLRQAAEQRKAAEAMAQQAEQAQAQARAAYERSLPEDLLVMKARYHEEFGTPTEAEIAEWEVSDPTRAVRWNGAYQRIIRAQREVDALQAQQAQRQWQDHQQFMQQVEAWKARETELFLEKAPEWKDLATYGAKVADMMEFLQNNIGFEREFLERAATEYLPIQIHDSKFQLLAWKARLYDKAIEATKQPARTPVPPVQRPGSAPNRGEAQEARFKNLTQQLDRTGSLRDGAALIAAMNGRR